MNNKNRFAFVFLVLLFSICLIGCNSGLKKLSGRVTYADNNEPLETGIVCFVNGSTFARGIIEADGKYTAGSFTENDGLPPGTYQVFVDAAKKSLGKKTPDADDFEYQQLIDPKFSRPETSGLTFVVKDSTNQFDFKVDRYSQ
ncbi:MAG: carboxypeptidase-like regulatory domain-containing protein [Planctomycetaceae bacterium]|jgi:hypothetical protein|nr:carboxypeptidase-like regulatory domain-containing protein [Planctomycetaceae bacterium]